MYIDLGIPWTPTGLHAGMTDGLAKYGYAGIALNVVHHAGQHNTGKPKRPPLPLRSPKVPKQMRCAQGLKTELQYQGSPDFMQWSRVTIVASSESALASALDFSKGFDIIAVRPTTDRCWRAAINHAKRIDIISFDMGENLGFSLYLKDVMRAIENGLTFEIDFGVTLRDVTMRRYVIQNAQWLLKYTRGKHVIMTTGARELTELRAPFDLVNFGKLLGVTTGHQVMSDTVIEVLRRAAERKENNLIHRRADQMDVDG